MLHACSGTYLQKAPGLQAEFLGAGPLETARERGFLGREGAVGVRLCEYGLIFTNTKENLGPTNPRAVPGDQLALWMGQHLSL